MKNYRGRPIYEATSIVTGEKKRGEAGELCVMLGVNRNFIYHCAREGIKCKREWTIKRIGILEKEEKSTGSREKLPSPERNPRIAKYQHGKDIWYEWEQVIKEFRERVNKCPDIPFKKKDNNYFRCPRNLKNRA